MPDYQLLYHQMFAAAADALEKLEEQNYGDAKEILLSAQLRAEAAVLEEEA